LKLEKGLPSHAIFSRVFRRLDPEQFRACLQKFMGKFSQACQGVVAMDGKVLCAMRLHRCRLLFQEFERKCLRNRFPASVHNRGAMPGMRSAIQRLPSAAYRAPKTM
jgi:hypothetical protein